MIKFIKFNWINSNICKINYTNLSICIINITITILFRIEFIFILTENKIIIIIDKKVMLLFILITSKIKSVLYWIEIAIFLKFN